MSCWRYQRFHTRNSVRAAPQTDSHPTIDPPTPQPADPPPTPTITSATSRRAVVTLNDLPVSSRTSRTAPGSTAHTARTVQDWPCPHPTQHHRVTLLATIKNISSSSAGRQPAMTTDFPTLSSSFHVLQHISPEKPGHSHSRPVFPPQRKLETFHPSALRPAAGARRSPSCGSIVPLQTPCLHLTHELHRRLLLPT